mgnify:CR=1
MGDPSALLVMFLFEEFKAELKFKDIKGLLQELGIPSTVPVVPPNPQLPKTDQQLQ